MVYSSALVQGERHNQSTVSQRTRERERQRCLISIFSLSSSSCSAFSSPLYTLLPWYNYYHPPSPPPPHSPLLFPTQLNLFHFQATGCALVSAARTTSTYGDSSKKPTGQPSHPIRAAGCMQLTLSIRVLPVCTLQEGERER